MSGSSGERTDCSDEAVGHVAVVTSSRRRRLAESNEWCVCSDEWDTTLPIAPSQPCQVASRTLLALFDVRDPMERSDPLLKVVVKAARTRRGQGLALP
jgi:hypothetical protein